MHTIPTCRRHAGIVRKSEIFSDFILRKGLKVTVMKIGGIELENNIFLAPMAGVTDLPFRRICRKYGCGMVCTEMVSAKGLYYGDAKTDTLMKLDDIEAPAAIQLFGSDPGIIAEVIRLAEKAGPQIIDINMGCPTPKIVNNGDGSALMKNPQLAGRIIRAAADKSKVPVTVKLRAGWDNKSINAVEIAKIAEENGACAITVHGRTREQFYTGNADRKIIKEVVDAVSVPVIGNGDIFSAREAVEMMEETGCAGVMVARGAQGNPFIFKQIEELMSTGEVKSYPTAAEKIDCALELFFGLIEEKGEARGVKEARKHIAWFLKGLRDNAEIKDRIFKLTSPEEIVEILEEYKLKVSENYS